MNSAKIFLEDEEISVTSPGHLDEIILRAEQAMPRDKRSKAYKAALADLQTMYKLYNHLTNLRIYNV